MRTSVDGRATGTVEGWLIFLALWRTVSGLVVLAIGRTSLSKATIRPKETRDAERVSRYSSSGAVCSVNSPARGLKVRLSAARQPPR
jgi:hypothetical protein